MHHGHHPRAVFARAAIAPALVLLGALCLSEPTQTRHQEANALGRQTWRKNLEALGAFFKQRAIHGPATFVFLSAAMPRTGHSMFFFYTDVLGFLPRSVALVSAVSHCWAVVGMFAYYMFLSSCRLRILFPGIIVTVALLTALPIVMILRANIALGLGDVWFIPFDDGLTSAALEVMILAVMTLSARQCPSQLEGTVCATLMATYNTGLFCGLHLSGHLTGSILGLNQHNLAALWVAKLATSFLQLVPLFFLTLLPNVSAGIGNDA